MRRLLFHVIIILTACVINLRFLTAARGQDEGPPLPAGLEESKTDNASEPALPAGLAGESEQGPEEPNLPTGLESTPEPALPAGMESGQGPPLPGGLQEISQPPAGETAKPLPEKMPKVLKMLNRLGITGFWEVRGGLRTQNDPHEKDASIGETRLQLEVEPNVRNMTFKFTADFVYDPVYEDHNVDLDAGKGWLQPREANVSLSPFSFMDLKLGRQILTWGTGDLLFLNDLFPKDWKSFFLGRDEDYLKAPSDALKASLFSESVNLDVVYTPKFDPDIFIRGERISYFNQTLGTLAGRDAVIDPDIPERPEWAARLWKNTGAYELAAYGYRGFWKSPGGQDPDTGIAIFPELSVYGASVRGPIGRGIGNLEAAYYDSREDRSGNKAFINNSEFQFLMGYELDLPEIAHDFTVGLQYYLQWMADYDNYRQSLPFGNLPRDEYRHVLTFRITKLLMNQNLTLSFFDFYSPSDADTYLRPIINYKIDDHWTSEIGANVFLGSSDHTFFGQFKNNNNIYMALRYGF